VRFGPKTGDYPRAANLAQRFAAWPPLGMSQTKQYSLVTDGEEMLTA